MYKDYPKVTLKKTPQNKTHPALFGQSLEENVQFDTSVLSLWLQPQRHCDKLSDPPSHPLDPQPYQIQMETEKNHR